MHFHWQNLANKENRRGDIVQRRPGFLNGRVWWRFSRDRVVALEWHHSWRPRRFGMEITTHNEEHGAMLFLGWAFGGYYLKLPWGTYGTSFGGRRTGFTIGFPEWWTVLAWRHEDDDFGRARHGWEWRAELADVILGRAKYREGAPEVHRIRVQMPEREYTGTATLRDDSWKRPLWFRKTIRRAHIDMDEGHAVPVPGKGENSYDIDDDAIYGLTCRAGTPAEAAMAVYESAMYARGKYASASWLPEKAAS